MHTSIGHATCTTSIGQATSRRGNGPLDATLSDVLGLEVWTSGQAAAVSMALRGGLGWSALGECFCGVPIALLWCMLAGDDHGCNERIVSEACRKRGDSRQVAHR